MGSEMCIRDRCLHRVKAFSASHTAPPKSRLGMHKKSMLQNLPKVSPSNRKTQATSKGRRTLTHKLHRAKPERAHALTALGLFS